MTSRPPTNPNAPQGPVPPGGDEGALDAYLDGRLTGEALAAFEAQLASSARLRAAVELQGRIDDVLRRRLSPPASLVIPGLELPGAMSAGDGLGGRGRGGWGMRGRGVWAAAAAVALLAAGSWWGWQQVSGRSGPVERLYTMQVAAGLRPDWVCGSDAEMVTYLEEQFGTGLLVPAAEAERAGVELVGWTSAPLLSQYTSVLLTRVGGEPVLVLVDLLGSVGNAGAQVTGPLPEGTLRGGLHVFRREVAGMVLLEVTPRDHAAVLELFRTPG